MNNADAIAAGDSSPLGATVAAPAASTSASSRRTPTSSSCCSSTIRRRPKPAETIPARSTCPTAPTTTGTRSCPGVDAGQVYGYRAHGPFAPERGLRFDSDKVLLDPYGRAVAVPDSYTRHAASRPGDNTAARHEERGRRCRAATTGKATSRCAGRSARRSSTSCTCADLPGTRAPASRRRSAAPSPASSRRFRICRIWASRRWSCCRCSSSIHRTRRPAT